MRMNVILCLLFILSGCVTIEQVDQRVSAWNNVTLTDLINSWGVPTKDQSIAGRKFYSWNNKANSSNPTIGLSFGSRGGHSGVSVSTLFGGDMEENMCSRVVEVDENEQVKSIQWSGEPELCFEVTPERLGQ